MLLAVQLCIIVVPDMYGTGGSEHYYKVSGLRPGATQGPTCVLYYDILYYTIVCTICYYDCADMYILLIAVKAKVRNLPMEQLHQSCLLLVCKDTPRVPKWDTPSQVLLAKTAGCAPQPLQRHCYCLHMLGLLILGFRVLRELPIPKLYINKCLPATEKLR